MYGRGKHLMGTSSEEESDHESTSSGEQSSENESVFDYQYRNLGSSSAAKPTTTPTKNLTTRPKNPPPKRRKRGVAGRITLRVEGHTLIFGSLDKRTNIGGKLFEKKAKMGGELGANHEPRGEVKKLKGKLYFKDKRCVQWTRGEYHETFREHFIREDSKKGNFTHPPERGDAEGDETSYIDYQKEWGEDESTWDHIVNGEGRKLFGGDQRPGSLDYEQPTNLWKHKGVLLIDQDNHPLRYLPDINRTFSSALEGWRLDALRKRFPYLLVVDVWSRMPSHRLHGKKIIPVQGLEAFTNRAYRFRKQYKIPDWNIRGGTGRERNRRHEEMMERFAREYADEEEAALRRDEESEAASASDDDLQAAPASGSQFINPRAVSTQNPNPPLTSNTGPRSQNADLPRRLHRASLPPRIRPLFDRQMELERARGTPDADIRLVPLFATMGARDQAYLNNRIFNSPWRVARAWREEDITATGGHLVIRPHNAPRAVDPDTGEVLEDVANLSAEEIERLRLADAADQYELDWFDG